MFAVFALSDEGIKFLKEKPDNCKDVEKLNRILRDLTALKDQALLSLELMSKGKMYKASADASEASQDKEQKCDSLGKPSEDANGAPLCDL